MVSKRIFFSLICLSFILININCRSSRSTANNTKKTIVTGAIENYDEELFGFIYDEYGLLKSTRNDRFDIDSNGNFKMELDLSNPITGTFNFGRVMIKGSGNNREIFTYLEPGDSLHVEANMDVVTDGEMIMKTLSFSGPAAANNVFINRVDWMFNSYPQKRQNNSEFIKTLQPEIYKRTVDSIKDEKLRYLAAYVDSVNISPKLKQIFELESKNLAVIRKFNYPSTNEFFNAGKKPVLPADYYEFVDKVKILPDLDDKGLPYLRYTNFVINNKFNLAKENGFTKSKLDFINTELSGRAKYIYMAYSLGSDFNGDVFYQFGKNAPYKDIAKIVKNKYGHLEKMLPGKTAPALVFTTINNESVKSTDYYKNQLVYVDIWATWCKPCIREFPYLDTLKEEYKGKNIRFVSVSFDAKKEDWEEYVNKHGMVGSQFWVDPANKKIYDDGFNITMIPRFVLIDTEGKIIDANAPLPSSGLEIRKLLNDNL